MPIVFCSFSNWQWFKCLNAIIVFVVLSLKNCFCWYYVIIPEKKYLFIMFSVYSVFLLLYSFYFFLFLVKLFIFSWSCFSGSCRGLIRLQGPGLGSPRRPEWRGRSGRRSGLKLSRRRDAVRCPCWSPRSGVTLSRRRNVETLFAVRVEVREVV
jgi:hypothetical protein